LFEAKFLMLSEFKAKESNLHVMFLVFASVTVLLLVSSSIATSALPTRADVAFVVDLVGSVATPGSCADTQPHGETADVHMWRSILDSLEAMKQQLGSDEVKSSIVDKAIFLTKKFRPDYSQHPAPALGFQKAVQGYLRRALLH
jgi:hypothetical protein